MFFDELWLTIKNELMKLQEKVEMIFHFFNEIAFLHHLSIDWIRLFISKCHSIPIYVTFLKSAIYKIVLKRLAYFTGWDTLFSTGDERQLIQLW